MNNKKTVVNIACVATICGIWTMRNDMCFQGIPWTSTRAILARIGASLHQWKILCVGNQSVLLRRCLQLLDRRRGELLGIAWALGWELAWRGPEARLWRLIQSEGMWLAYHGMPLFLASGEGCNLSVLLVGTFQFGSFSCSFGCANLNLLGVAFSCFQIYSGLPLSGRPDRL